MSTIVLMMTTNGLQQMYHYIEQLEVMSETLQIDNEDQIEDRLKDLMGEYGDAVVALRDFANDAGFQGRIDESNLSEYKINSDNLDIPFKTVEYMIKKGLLENVTDYYSRLVGGKEFKGMFKNAKYNKPKKSGTYFCLCNIAENNVAKEALEYNAEKNQWGSADWDLEDINWLDVDFTSIR